MKGKLKAGISVNKLCWVIAVVGAALCVFIFILCTGSDKNSAAKIMTDVSDYVKEQCIRYDEIVAETGAKDLFALADKVSEMRDELMLCMGDGDLFRAIAERKRIDGIVVWNEETDGYGGFLPEGEEFEYWKQTIDIYSVAADNLDSTYVERVFKNEYCYDYALVGRIDVKGTIIGFTRRDIDTIESTQLSVKTLLDGYKFGKEGSVIVTDGTRVIAANNSEHVGMKAAECPVVKVLREIDGYRTLEYVGSERVYAIREKCKEYFIYVYLPKEEVFADRSLISAYVALFYLAALFAMFTLRHRFIMNKTVEQKKKETEYRKELDRLAAEAIRANDVKTEFLRRMSHDVRTPINGIRGMVKIGDYYADDLDKQKECREKVWKASGYLLELVNDVLDMTKLDAKDLPYKEENFSVGALVSDISSVTSFQASEHGVNLNIKAENILHDKLFGAATLLKRTCTNLISNAINYNNPGGSATFTLRETGCNGEKADFEIVCSDNGVGMSEEFKKVMFEPFAQETPGIENRTGGAGLGLTIVKKTIEKLNGTIEVETEKGKGTTFRVNISFKLAGNTPIMISEKVESSAEPLFGLNVLVVEDNELNLEIAEFMLKTAGAKVYTAGNGEEAVAKFSASALNFYDVILMDVMMPVKDGLTAAKEIRELKREDAAFVPIIAMTANAFYDDVERVREAGMNGHVSKPLDAKKLIKTILILLDNPGEGGGYLVAKDEDM